MGRSKRQESAIGFGLASPSKTGPNARGAMAALRLSYFACANESAGRYGVTFDDVIRHLWHFRNARGRVLLETTRGSASTISGPGPTTCCSSPA